MKLVLTSKLPKVIWKTVIALPHAVSNDSAPSFNRKCKATETHGHEVRTIQTITKEAYSTLRKANQENDLNQHKSQYINNDHFIDHQLVGLPWTKDQNMLSTLAVM